MNFLWNRLKLPRMGEPESRPPADVAPSTVWHPYTDLPDAAYWRRSIANIVANDVDPVVEAGFRISPTDRVATAGSCFAQHIARHLSASGYNFFVTETAHPLATEEMARECGYGLFTARYGNLYTSRQLLQLFDRAYGTFEPADNIWHLPNGRFVDPFRPQIQPGGFATVEALQADRRQHLACVRRAFEELDVFVFTLGLTEFWFAREDGAAYPLCPGVAGGEFDEDRHVFGNLEVDDVVGDMAAFLERLRGMNPRARLLLTVSPVPLVATADGRHVLTATTYSKSVLRVAAETLSRRHDAVAYFPSYEIITGSYTRGKYFAADCRSVTEDGVEHVMRLFMKHYGSGDVAAPEQVAKPVNQTGSAAHLNQMERLVEVDCDEEMLDR